MPNSTNIDLVTARYVLGVGSSDELVRMAHDLIEDGVICPSLIDLISSGRPVMSDVGPLFERACSELGKQLPMEKDALHSLIWYRLSDIVSERVSVCQGLSTLMSETGTSIFHDREADSTLWELQDLVGLYFEFDDLDDSVFGAGQVENAEARRESWAREIEQNVRSIAQAWLAAHPETELK